MSDADQTFDQTCIIEEWRPVVGFEDVYEVSSLGRVRRSGRAARNGAGRGGGARIGRLLKLRPIRNGYLQAQLWHNGQPKPRLVHVLVAAAFIGPVPGGQEVNHRDGVKANNWPGNLEYVTRGDNIRHAYVTGLRRPTGWRPGRRASGEAVSTAKLTTAQVAEIRRLYRPRIYSTCRLAREFGVGQRTISKIVNGQTWKATA